MAIQINGTTVIDNTPNLVNVGGLKTVGGVSILGSGDIAVGGGGETFTASGAISAGDLVVLNSNGTVSSVTDSTSLGTAGSQTAKNFDPSSTGRGKSKTAYHPVEDRFVVMYADEGSTYDLKVAVVKINDDYSTEYGTPVTINTGFFSIYNSWDVTYDPPSGKMILAYQYGIVTFSVSNMSITLEHTAVAIDTSTVKGGISLVYDEAAEKTVVVYNRSDYLNARTVTFTGSTVSLGTKGTLSGSLPDPETIYTAYDSVEEVIVVVYEDEGSDRLEAVCVSVSGTTCTFGTEVQVNANKIDHDYSSAIVYDVASGKTLFFYREGEGTFYAQGTVLSVSGTTITVGSTNTISTLTSVLGLDAAYDPEAARTVVFWYYPSTGSEWYAQPVTVSGTSMSYGTVVAVGAEALQGGETLYDPVRKVFITSAYKGSSQYIYASAKFTVNSNVDQWIGIAEEAISSGSTGSITVTGGVNDQQSGLTIGSNLYGTPSGDIVSGVTDYPIGTALSATDVVITEQSGKKLITPSITGTAGQYLVSNGSRTPSWVTPDLGWKLLSHNEMDGVSYLEQALDSNYAAWAFVFDSVKNSSDGTNIRLQFMINGSTRNNGYVQRTDYSSTTLNQSNGNTADAVMGLNVGNEPDEGFSGILQIGTQTFGYGDNVAHCWWHGGNYSPNYGTTYQSGAAVTMGQCDAIRIKGTFKSTEAGYISIYGIKAE
jgi:hypothetical protein